MVTAGAAVVQIIYGSRSIARNLTGIAGEARHILLSRQVQGSVSGAIEICVYVLARDSCLRPVRAKIVSPLELQVVLAAGTLISLLEPQDSRTAPARLRNDRCLGP